MSELHIEGLSKRFGSVDALVEATLRIPQGEFICLLGPSGCGKTTMLRLIAGLEDPDQGVIRLGDNIINAQPAHKRNFGMVFQSHALFPHLNVGDNIAYGLRIRGWSKADQARRVEELLELVRLPGVASRSISQLSGGQRQRIAIARALALEPELFLLDEPLSALDAKLREELQVELRQIQQRLGITTLLVTHDQREAMTMSDRVVIMNKGRIQQEGAPLDIYRQPVNTFVAQFIGRTNLLTGLRIEGGAPSLNGRPFRLAAGLPGTRLPAGGVAREMTLSIRPEDVHVFPGDLPGENRFTGKITFVRDVGLSIETYIHCGNLELVSIATRKDHSGARVGDQVTAELPPEACVVLSS
ncbi:MAG: ABC transporter ATP-binding protein [Deltaproteobacteria bacterium]|nr:ABC transporter ATP-binding protein [Deltaproteobacteria bacterium]